MPVCLHGVLIVDRETRARQELARHLRGAGYRVDEVAKRGDALQLMCRRRPDLVLHRETRTLDDTWELLSDICRLTDTPIILLVPVNATGPREYLGATMCLDKSTPAREICAQVQALLTEEARKRTTAEEKSPEATCANSPAGSHGGAGIAD